MITEVDKFIIVEGKTDKKKILSILKEKVEILCTNGTMSVDKLDEWAEMLDDKELYILVDADSAGEKLRKQLDHEFPNARHIHIDKMYKEVAASPSSYLASLLLSEEFNVDTNYLKGRGKHGGME